MSFFEMSDFFLILHDHRMSFVTPRLLSIGDVREKAIVLLYKIFEFCTCAFPIVLVHIESRTFRIIQMSPCSSCPISELGYEYYTECINIMPCMKASLENDLMPATIMHLTVLTRILLHTAGIAKGY